MQPHHTLAERALDNIRVRRKSLKHTSFPTPLSHSEHIGFWRPMVVHMPCLRKWSTEQTRLVRSIVTLEGTPQVHTSKEQVSLWCVCWPSSSALNSRFHTKALRVGRVNITVASPTSPRGNEANRRPIPDQGASCWKTKHRCQVRRRTSQASRQKSRHPREDSPSPHPQAPQSRRSRLHVKNVLTHGKIHLVHTFKLRNSSTRSEKKRFSPDPAISPKSRPGREPPSPATVDG